MRLFNCIYSSLSPLSQGKRIKCSTSKAKHRLFIGNVPRSWGEEDLRKVVMKIGPGVTGIELVKVCAIYSVLMCPLFIPPFSAW